MHCVANVRQRILLTTGLAPARREPVTAGGDSNGDWLFINDKGLPATGHSYARVAGYYGNIAAVQVSWKLLTVFSGWSTRVPLAPSRQAQHRDGPQTYIRQFFPARCHINNNAFASLCIHSPPATASGATSFRTAPERTRPPLLPPPWAAGPRTAGHGPGASSSASALSAIPGPGTTTSSRTARSSACLLRCPCV